MCYSLRLLVRIIHTASLGGHPFKLASGVHVEREASSDQRYELFTYDSRQFQWESEFTAHSRHETTFTIVRCSVFTQVR